MEAEKMSSDQYIYYRGNQGNNDHADIWDDRVIIKAYDKAVNLAKESIANRNKDMESESDGPGKKQKSRLKNKTKDHKHKTRKWKVGDNCKAIFSEDGLLYPATVESIDTDAGTCVVKFVGYGNEESVTIESLMVSKNRQMKNRSKSDTKFERDGTSSPRSMDCSDHWENGSNSRHSNSWGFHNRFPPQRDDESPSWFNTSFPVPPTRVTNGSFPPFCMPPPSYPGMGCSSTCHSGHWNGPRCSSIPPLPPPPIPPLHPDSPDEVLASTLISWYMSGYHTGFYQAMRLQSSNCHSRGSTPPYKKNKGQK